MREPRVGLLRRLREPRVEGLNDLLGERFELLAPFVRALGESLVELLAPFVRRLGESLVELVGSFVRRLGESRLEGLSVALCALAELRHAPHHGSVGLLDLLPQRGNPIVEDPLDLSAAAFHLPLEVAQPFGG